ncbi:MAG: DUF1667 domain-containing protein [Oscillospiraceae bacterium]|nr:DUF1667 domain-containing protein [Oscillospiraceae bacterium]
MKKLYCIDCPLGCELEVIGSGKNIVVEGNKCIKGKDFAISETTNPMRVLTTTVRTNFPDIPVIPVRTDGEIPKGMLMNAMHELSSVVVEDELGCGDVIIHNLLGTGVSVIITSGALQSIGAELENRNVQLSGNITTGPSGPVATELPTVTADVPEPDGGDSSSEEELPQGRAKIRS